MSADEGNLFYATIAAVYDAIFPVRQEQIALVSRRCREADRVLDAGCATGALAAALSRRGLRVTGIDVDAALLRHAQTRRSTDSTLQFCQLDMRQMATKFACGSFECVVCLGNTVSHLPAVERTDFYRQVRRLLSPEGVFVVQIVHYDRILHQGLTELPPIRTPHLSFERYYDDFRPDGPFCFRAVLTLSGGEPMTQEMPLFPVFRDDMAHELIDSGMEPPLLFGSFAEAPLTPDSFHLIAVTRPSSATS